MVYPPAFSAEFVDLLQHLLVTDPLQRYTTKEVKSHAWFRPITWPDLVSRAIKPPYVPSFSHEGDAGHFDRFAEEEIRSCEVEEYPEHFGAF